MAAYGSLHHIFDKPLETTTVPPFDSIPTCKHNNSIKPVHDSNFSFLDMLSEPHFMEKSDSVSKDFFSTKEIKPYQSNVNMNAESLFMCTEGLGFESFDDVEDTKTEENIKDHHECFDTTTKQVVVEILHGETKRSRIKGVEFPPPISSIGMSGKPWVCLKSYRSNGRFILKEVRIPTQELLHACREDGRLKLQYIQSSDDESSNEDEDLNLDLEGDCDATREKDNRDESL